MRDTLHNLITTSLTDLANAREYEAVYPSGCKPIISGVTHCESCGFHYSTPVHVATPRNACKTPERHVQNM